MASAMKTMLEKLHITSKPTEAPPKEPSKEDLAGLREKYEKAKQDHVFKYYDELDVAGRASLFSQLFDMDPERINEIYKKTLHSPKSDDDQPPKLEPLPDSACASILDASEDDTERWYSDGMQLVADNKVGVVLMAGGQGTRLGSSDPKGCYNIGLPSGKSLFQLQAERIIKLQLLAAHRHKKDQVVIPWYIMTSGPTTKPTQEFFAKHEHFGLDKENVMFFEQGVLPCLSDNGKILLESKFKVAVAPDGNGGIYQAMFLGSVVSDMKKRGIEHVHAYCVDNCLVKVADPAFMGFAASKHVDIATKVVRKRDAKESVGLIMEKNGRPDVVEYSEIDEAMAEAKDAQNSELLKFRAANIVNHYYSFSFLESIPEWSRKLPHHIARKKIPYIDLDKDELVKPEKPNGVKLEQFVFDCFPLLEMKKFACLEVKREEEFSPLKNGKDSKEDNAETSRKDILNQGSRWLGAVGAVVVSESTETGVEISPLISYGGEGLSGFKGKEITAPAVIEKEKA